jgi:hypothetical protein
VVAVLLLRPELVSLCLLALLRFRERSPMSSATTAPAFPCSASSSALRCQQRASSSRSSATARACHGMIAKLSGSQAKPCAIGWASAAGGGVQNGAVMCNRPGSLGSGCQLGGVAFRWTGIQQRTVERQRIEGLAVALLWQRRRAVRPGSAPVAMAGWAASMAAGRRSARRAGAPPPTIGDVLKGTHTTAAALTTAMTSTTGQPTINNFNISGDGKDKMELARTIATELSRVTRRPR